MNRIDAAFARLRELKRKAFIPYLTAGLPDAAGQIRLLRELQDAGATLVEIGVPYSDPIADGPVIQASFNEALKRGVTRDKIFDIVRQARAAGITIPLAAMVAYAVVHRYGPREYLTQAAAAGFDGLIVPDLPVDEAAALAEMAAQFGLKLVLLTAPTTPAHRRKRIAQLSTGFIYCLSITGITGERTELPAELAANVKALRAETDKPVCVGFGISKPEHVAAAAREADGVIVGSAIVRKVLDAGGDVDRMVRDVGALARSLIAALPQ